MSGSDDLGLLLAGALPGATNDRVVSGRVADITSEGRVNLVIDGALATEVPCADSYRARAVGDWVAVRISAGQPVVMWRLGADLGLGAVSDVTWGNVTPSGYAEADGGVFFRRNSDGSVGLHLKASTTPPVQSNDPPPDTGAIVRPTDTGVWAGGWRDATQTEPAQGVKPGATAENKGAWFYGTSIFDACTGDVVTAMYLKLIRAVDYNEGFVTLALWNHSYTAAPTAGEPAFDEGPEDLAVLTPGAVRRIALPETWVSALAAGTRRGLGVLSGSQPYMSFLEPDLSLPPGESCGDIEIVFA